MKRMIALPLLALATSLTAAHTAWATPSVKKVTVACALVNGENRTVTVLMARLQGAPYAYFKYSFRNVLTSQTTVFRAEAQEFADVSQSFPVLQGTYDLTVAVTAEGPQYNVLPSYGAALQTGIVVPKSASTGGRGTGCAFVTTPMPAMLLPKKPS